jgi:hypothetical protein
MAESDDRLVLLLAVPCDEAADKAHLVPDSNRVLCYEVVSDSFCDLTDNHLCFGPISIGSATTSSASTWAN